MTNPQYEDYATALGVFERLNIAQCAAKRAVYSCSDADRFNGEYLTVKAWMRYRCYISRKHSFIEP